MRQWGTHEGGGQAGEAESAKAQHSWPWETKPKLYDPISKKIQGHWWSFNQTNQIHLNSNTHFSQISVIPVIPEFGFKMWVQLETTAINLQVPCDCFGKTPMINLCHDYLKRTKPSWVMFKFRIGFHFVGWIMLSNFAQAHQKTVLTHHSCRTAVGDARTWGTVFSEPGCVGQQTQFAWHMCTLSRLKLRHGPWRLIILSSTIQQRSTNVRNVLLNLFLPYFSYNMWLHTSWSSIEELHT